MVLNISIYCLYIHYSHCLRYKHQRPFKMLTLYTTLRKPIYV